MKVAIIIPAFNEEETIRKVVTSLVRVFDSTDHDYEIVVVNDASTDKTAAKAKKAGAKVISHYFNMGAGGATATGLSYSAKNGFEVVASSDGDGQHAAADVLRGVEEIIKNKNVDLLIGSRMRNNKSMPFIKIIGNKIITWVTFLLFGVRVSDSQSGLRIFSKRALSSLSWNSHSYEFCSEMLHRAKKANLRVEEYPIDTIYSNYSISKGQNNWNGINIIKKLLLVKFIGFFGE